VSQAKEQRNGASSEKTARLRPEHRRLLKERYGHSDETIDTFGCFTVAQEDLADFAPGVQAPGIALPILAPRARKAVDFLYRPDKPRQFSKNGKVRIAKYEYAVGALNHMHVPQAVQARLFGPDGNQVRVLVVTEGPIKAEAAAQAGIDCVALLGVWNFRQKFGDLSVPIEDLDKLPWSEFDAVEICFDSDAATNPNVRKAERALALWLLKHGARNVFIVRLSAAADGSKVGLDDFLRNHSAEEFKKLPRLAFDAEPPLDDLVANLTPDTEKAERNGILGRILDEEHDPSEQERLLKIAAQRTKLPIRALRSSAQAAAAILQKQRRENQAAQPPLSAEQALEAEKKRQAETRAAVENILKGAHKAITLRGQNAEDGEFSYIVPFGEAGSLYVSTAGVMPVTKLPANYRITEPPPNSSPMSAEGIRSFEDGEDVDPVKLLKFLQEFIRRRVIFTQKCVPTFLALWLMGTYCYSLFNYFGYVWLTSLGPGCGKSLVAKILSMLAFNATPPFVDPTPATVFRDIEANGSTLILDEVEHLDPESKGELLAILNAGFERGAKVPRATPKGDGWEVRKYNVYGSKSIAGINKIPRPLQTRAFHIEMQKRKDSEKIWRFHPDRLTEWAADRRDDMAIFALRNAKRITDLYQKRDELVPQRSDDGDTVYDDRLLDIFAPLYVMAALVDEQAAEPVAKPQLDEFLQLQAGARDSEGAGDYVLAAHAIWNWAKERWRDGKILVSTAQAKELFADAEIEWAALDSAKAKSLLRKIGGRNEATWWQGKTQRGYVFFQTELQDLVERNPISAKRIRGEKR
jgi:hypothetical protein